VKICAGREIFAVNAYRPITVGVIQTVLPGVKPSVLDKTLRVTEARLARSGGRLTAERRTPHEVAPVAAAATALARDNDMVVIFGASAMSDFADVVPAAIERAGGTVVRAGMPVDPGNLLVLGTLDGKRVVGAPGCARSPKENGFDWILTRLLCGLPVTRHDVTAMGVGGLLMEIVTRPQPRESQEEAGRRIAAIVLAAGRSTRMGGPNKLLADVGGRPLVRIAVEEALASRAQPVVVVTGHQREQVEAALKGLPVILTHNPDFAQGLSTSLKAGLAALPAGADGAIVCLGDMPQVDAGLIDRLVAAFEPEKGALVVVPTIAGKRGNPVVWSRRFFADLSRLDGDVGARHLIGAYPEAVVEVPVTGRAAFVDVDTPDALRAVRAEIAGSEQAVASSK